MTGYANSLHTVFLIAVPVGALAFLLSWTLKEVPLRTTTRAPDPADTLAPTARPAVRDSTQEMERAVTSLLSRERRSVVYSELVAAAKLPLAPRAGWLLLRVGEHPGTSRQDLARLLHLPVGEPDRRLAELTESGYVAPLASDDGQPPALTEAGAHVHASLLRAREERLHRLCADWHPERYPELLALLNRITHQLAASGEKPGRDLEVA